MSSATATGYASGLNHLTVDEDSKGNYKHKKLQSPMVSNEICSLTADMMRQRFCPKIWATTTTNTNNSRTPFHLFMSLVACTILLQLMIAIGEMSRQTPEVVIPEATFNWMLVLYCLLSIAWLVCHLKIILIGNYQDDLVGRSRLAIWAVNVICIDLILLIRVFFVELHPDRTTALLRCKQSRAWIVIIIVGLFGLTVVRMLLLIAIMMFIQRRASSNKFLSSSVIAVFPSYDKSEASSVKRMSSAKVFLIEGAYFSQQVQKNSFTDPMLMTKVDRSLIHAKQWYNN